MNFFGNNKIKKIASTSFAVLFLLLLLSLSSNFVSADVYIDTSAGEEVVTAKSQITSNEKKRDELIKEKDEIKKKQQEITEKLQKATIQKEIDKLKEERVDLDLKVRARGGIDERIAEIDELLKAKKAIVSSGGKLPDTCEPGWFGEGSFSMACLREAFARILGFFLYILSGVTWVVSEIFTFVVEVSINEMASFAQKDVVISAWKVLRDLVNMFALMIMMYIAIGTILSLDSVNWKKMISTLIFAVVMINFSMAITGIIIDVSNVFAVYFYDKARGGPNGNLTSVFIERLSLKQQLASGQAAAEKGDSELKDVPSVGAISINALMTTVFMIVFLFVLFFASALFIVRIISLIIALILSPLPWIAMVAPKSISGKISSGYWENLINQAFFAPAFMLGIYITMKLIVCGDLISSINKGWKIPILGGSVDTIFSHIIILGFLFSSIIMAKKMGATGASGAEKFGKWATGATIGLATGAAMVGAGSARSVYRGIRDRDEEVKDKEGRVTSGAWANIQNDWSKNIGKPVAEKISTKAGMLGESIKEKVTSPGSTISELVKTGTGFEIMETKGEREAGEKAEKAYKAKQEIEQKKKEMQRVSSLVDWDNMTQEQKDNYARDNNLGLVKAEEKARKEFKEYADEKHNGNLDNAKKGIEKEIREGLSLFRGDKILDLGIKKLMENNGKIAQWLDEAQIKALEEKGNLKPDQLIALKNTVHSNERNYRGRKHVELDVVQGNWNSYDTKDKKIKALKSMSAKNAAELEDSILDTDEAAEAFDKDDLKKLKEVGRKKMADKIEARKNLPDTKRQLTKAESDLIVAGGSDPSLISKRDELRTKVAELESIINNP